MVGKLSKTGKDYLLRDSKGETLAISNGNIKGRMLSLKNCQAIESGYDLDELAYDFSWNHQSDPNYGDTINIFKSGFQKALEILGDKKFSINEVVELTKILISNPFEKCGKTYQELTDSYIQSLQQKEWDVEVEMECPQCQEWGYISECRNNCNKKFLQPKLDKDGCLILKLV